MISKELKGLRKFITDNYRGHCRNGNYECCGGVMMTKEEKERIDAYLKLLGLKKPPQGKGKDYCEYLTKEGKCSVYAERPIICRSFGLIKEMHGPCQGCTSEKQMTTPGFLRGYLSTCTIANEWAKRTLKAVMEKNKQVMEQRKQLEEGQ